MAFAMQTRPAGWPQGPPARIFSLVEKARTGPAGTKPGRTGHAGVETRCAAYFISTSWRTCENVPAWSR